MGLARWRSGGFFTGNLIMKQKTWGIYEDIPSNTWGFNMIYLVVKTWESKWYKNCHTKKPLVMKHAMATESLPFNQVNAIYCRNVGFFLPCSMSCREYLSWYLRHPIGDQHAEIQRRKPQCFDEVRFLSGPPRPIGCCPLYFRAL